MSIYAQHGYGKSSKIEDAIAEGILKGVVLSPRDETPSVLADYVAQLRKRFGDKVQLLFDPQFYASTVSPARVRHLVNYEYFGAGERTQRYFNYQANIARHTEQALRFQAELPLDRIIAPTVLVPDLTGPWGRVALSLGVESIAAVQRMSIDRPTLASIVLEESALANGAAVDDLLDEITRWDVHGFYLIVATSERSYPAKCDEQRLANLLYLVYALANQNGFEVIAGYTDLVGLLLHAVGATATTTGWFNSLRQFSMSRFEPASGGGAARARYTSAPLLNSILVTPELDGAYRVGEIARVLSNTSYDNSLRTNPNPDNWPADRSCLNHWQVLSRTVNQISSLTVPKNLDSLLGLITAATDRYAVLTSLGVPFEAASGPRNLKAWIEAIAIFRERVGI